MALFSPLAASRSAREEAPPTGTASRATAAESCHQDGRTGWADATDGESKRSVWTVTSCEVVRHEPVKVHARVHTLYVGHARASVFAIPPTLFFSTSCTVGFSQAHIRRLSECVWTIIYE